jgi:pyrimidine-nucleoside phosphorylase
MDCTKMGWAVQRLGAGRARPGDPVSAQAGIEMHAKIGDRVEAGQPLVTLFAENARLLDEPEEMVRGTLRIADVTPAAVPLVREIIARA